ncbi:diguanylate cyclase [Roseospirillum parvum]|uniref:Diguanylate cyclase (GGDEF) domain-containing protein n=1 Tax=Roseospirillum parvum TaxID=83401 RepID=A0A1G7XRZ3_9PROT|nr:diguanylate cyclase [Roseospirillum parvum]SDG86904.1 diguanylate cyclase (GGDEF) domain-containing protein [Roseospirillum parvum]
MPQYAVLGVVHQGPVFRYVRALDHERGARVILKAANTDDPKAANDTAWPAVLEQEFGVLSLGGGQRILRPVSLDLFNGGRAIRFADAPGVVLSEALKGGPVPWRRALAWAADIADALQDLHDGWIVHRTINPASFLWNPETDQLRLMDAAWAVKRDPGMPYSVDSEGLVGALAYLSPEQTGRTGSPIDHRGDLYSLGALLFEALTGEVPFPAAEPMEVIHAHLTRPVPDASARNPDVPPPVAAVVARLLAKDPGERYQSAFGLRVDVESLLAQGRAGAPLDTVSLHAVDPPSNLKAPQRLHGRNREVAALRAAHGRARQGAFEMVMVGGESGCGKTRLVQELERAVAAAGERFVAVKLDPSASAMPHLPLSAALGQLVADLLARGEGAVEAFRDALPEHLEENAALAVELVPGLGGVLRPAASAPAVPTQEAQSRALHILRDLIDAFTAQGRALVLFFDDLQWADAASLQALAALGRDRELHDLLILGAYRDNEVGEGHPLRETLATLREAPVAVSEFHLSRLDGGAVAALVADCLHRPVEDVADLAQVCAAKTLGNPFFLSQFLHTLVRGGCLAFDHRRGRWEWQPEAVGRMAAADNVAGLMVERLHTLPAATQRVLVLNACADAAVDLATLAALCDQPLAQTARAMAHAVDAGLVQVSGPHGGDGTPGRPSADHPQATCRFVHDRIQEAALALLRPDERPAVHLRIGRTLRDTLDAGGLEERLFQVIYHFQWARALLDDPAERLAVAGLALAASRKAAATGGFGPMLDHARLGLALLPPQPWAAAYELTLGLHGQCVAGAFITHQHDYLAAMTQAVLDHAATPLDKTLVVEYQVLKANADGAMAESIDLGLAFLEELGVSFPRHPTGEDIGAGLAQVQAVLAGRGAEDLADLPEMTDPVAHAFMRLCNAMAGPTYNAEPALFLCMVFKQVEWFVRYGNCADAVAGYSTYAMALCVVPRQYREGQAFGELAFRLAERYKAGHLKGRLHLNVYLFVHHWRHHLGETLAPLMEGYRQAYSHGDLLYASLNSVVYCHHTWWIGTRLPEVEAIMAERHAVIQDAYGHHEVARWTRLFRQTVRNLRADTPDPVALEGDIFDERVGAPAADEPDQTFVLLYHLCKLILAVTFEDRARISRHLAAGLDFLPACNGIVIVPVFQFFGFLGRVLLLRHPEAPPTPQAARDIRAALEVQAEEMRQWAEHGPMNFAHKHALMAALLAWLDGDLDGALGHFEAAIDGARRHGYLWDQAIIQEWLGRVCREQDRPQLGAMTLREALRGYATWGGGAKVAQMVARHGALLSGSGLAPGGDGGGEADSAEAITHQELDLGAVLKASQAIGAEIVLGRLLDRMMQTVLETAGADRGVLLRVGAGGGLRLWAEKRVGEPTRVLPEASDPATEQLLPLALVNRVLASGQTMIVPGTASDGRGDLDLSLERHAIRSALCLPIRVRDQAIVLLYLENRVTPNVFTHQRVRVLDLLAGQIAVSLENARLYEELEARVAERTRELQDKMSELSEAYESVSKIQVELEAQAVELMRANDITEAANRELVEKNALIQRMASTDALTGLCNRRHFDHTLAKELERARRYGKALSMAIVDIDHFKRFNDRHGHACGDRVLETVAGVLTARVRTADTVARWGGEEFCVLMPETDLEGALRLMEDIRAAIAATSLPDVADSLTASVGVATLDPIEDQDGLFQRVDAALYVAKEKGRNQVRLHRQDRIV